MSHLFQRGVPSLKYHWQSCQLTWVARGACAGSVNGGLGPVVTVARLVLSTWFSLCLPQHFTLSRPLPLPLVEGGFLQHYKVS